MRLTPAPLWSTFCEYFGVFLILDNDYMWSEVDFTREKSHFHPTINNLNSVNSVNSEEAVYSAALPPSLMVFFLRFGTELMLLY